MVYITSTHIMPTTPDECVITKRRLGQLAVKSLDYEPRLREFRAGMVLNAGDELIVNRNGEYHVYEVEVE
jgi:hypothetical protein